MTEPSGPNPGQPQGWGPPQGQPPAGGPPAKKPLWKKKRVWIPGVILLLFIIGSATGNGSKKPDASTTAAAPAATSAAPAQPSAAATSVAPPPAATSAAPPAAPAVTFPGQLKDDKLAGGSGGSAAPVELSGWTTTATALNKQNTGFSKIVCSTVTLANRDKKAQSYSITSWKLQTPGGNVQDVNFQGDKILQGNGSLIPGGTVTGSVCFDDPGQAGQYVLAWTPDQFSSKARGIWVNAL